MKKLTLVFICSVFIIFTFGCSNNIKNDDLKWDNEHAIYAFVNPKFKENVLNDIDNAFQNLNYKKLYIVGKNDDFNETLKLLFILNDNDKLESFRQELLNDEKISCAMNCFDLPFDTIDTRYIECEKTNIEIGEELSIQLKGTKLYYTQQFSYNGFIVKPQNSKNNIYKISDFPNINLKKIEKKENGWLYFELKTEDYFNLIKSMDAIARLNNIEKIDIDISNVTVDPPLIWISSDNRIVELIQRDGIVIVKGLSKGKAVVEYDGVRLEITVN